MEDVVRRTSTAIHRFQRKFNLHMSPGASPIFVKYHAKFQEIRSFWTSFKQIPLIWHEKKLLRDRDRLVKGGRKNESWYQLHVVIGARNTVFHHLFYSLAVKLFNIVCRLWLWSSSHYSIHIRLLKICWFIKNLIQNSMEYAIKVVFFPRPRFAASHSLLVTK